MDAGNSVDVRYALGRKQLRDYNKIVHRNTEIFSIPYEIVFFFIVSARKHKNQLPQYSHPTVRNTISSVAPRTIISVLHPTLWKFPWACLTQHGASLLYRFQDFCNSVQYKKNLLLAFDSPYPEICLTRGQRFGKNKSLAEYVHGDNG